MIAHPAHRWPWLFNVLYPVAVALMIGCVVFALVAWAEMLLDNGWNGAYLVITCILFSLEAVYAEQRSQLHEKDANPFTLMAEIIGLLVILRLMRYLGMPLDTFSNEVNLLTSYPIRIFDAEFFGGLAVAFPAWYMSISMISELQAAGSRPELYRDYVPPMHRLTNRFYWGGGVLMLATGLIGMVGNRLNLNSYTPALFALNLLIYFVLGMFVLSHVRMTSLVRLWDAERTEMPPTFSARWLRSTLLLLGGALLFTLLLPTGQSIGLFDIIGVALRGVAALFPQSTSSPASPAVPPMVDPRGIPYQPLPPLEGNVSPHANATVEISQSSSMPLQTVLWVLVGVLVLTVIYGYIMDRPELREAFSRATLVKTAQRWWSRLIAWLRHLWAALVERTPRPRLPAAPIAIPFTRPRWFRLGTLPSRERVIFHYLGMLRRAAQQGLQRRHMETPQEYAASLTPHLPDVSPDIEHLTDLFETARYSDHAIEPPHADQARTAARRIRDVLRRLANS